MAEPPKPGEPKKKEEEISLIPAGLQYEDPFSMKTVWAALFVGIVMLPGGMSGKRLADLVKDRNPDLPILYMSGYTENAIIHQRRLEKGIHLLQKPFRRKDIAQAVRRILDGPPT